MSEIRIYVEGGRSGKQAEMRRAFNNFFDMPRQQARQKGAHWQVIICGSRNDAY